MRGIALGNTQPWKSISNAEYSGASDAVESKPVFENNSIFMLSTFSNMHIASQTICGLICGSCTFTEVRFSNSVIECGNFFDSTFSNCTFEECYLLHAEFEHTTWTECTFLGTILPYSRFLHAVFNGDSTRFEDCDVHGVLFSNKEKEGLSFSICNEEEAHFDIKV